MTDATQRPCGLLKLLFCQNLAHAANHLSAELVQNGKTAAALAEEHGHANVAALLTTRTDRPSTNRTPSASPLPSSSQGLSPLHNLPSQIPPPTHQSPSSHQQSERASAPCLPTATSTPAGTPHAVSYPSIFGAAPAQNPPSPHHMGQLGSEHALASQCYAPPAEEARRLNRPGGVGGHSEPPVQADAPALGYVPGALSFIRNKLQVLLLYQTHPCCNILHSYNGRCCQYSGQTLVSNCKWCTACVQSNFAAWLHLWFVFLHTCLTTLNLPPPPLPSPPPPFSSLGAMLSQHAA